MRKLWRVLPATLRPFVVRALELALRLSSRRAGLALVYHAASAHQGDLEREVGRAHDADLFEAQLRYVSRRYRLVPARELLGAVRARRRGERYPVALTFDDDLPTHVQTAMPALRRVGAPAAFFLCGASLDRPFAFWWERLQRAVDEGIETSEVVGEPLAPLALALRIEEETPKRREEIAEDLGRLVGADTAESGMRAADVRALVDGGFDIGFHTLRHDRLPPLNDALLADALSEGRAELEAAAGRRLTMIAYPHGRADERVAGAARSAGFHFGFTGAGEAVTAGSDALLLSRIEPSFTDLASFAGQLVDALRRAHR
jgi:peptidoglycan/xylan/chitin deacetylase (PgdA/CDA1 family)